MGLGWVDKAKLKSALSTLPSAIVWLREPILKVAAQDQDLLGCGEADPKALIKALRSQSSSEGDFEPVADALRDWANRLGDDKNSAWACPIWFVEGFVRGCDMFGADAADLDEPTPKQLPLGLKEIDLDIPPGMKRKLYVDGVEMTDRTVQIIVGGLDEASYEIRARGFQSPEPLGTGQTPHLRAERDAAFAIGQLSGVKITYRHIESKLVVMAMYMLALGNLHIEASIFAKKQTGCEIGHYEQILATIRRR